ncbi:hypothetical protein Pmani_003206 [Petrolisthes manimaculis]|uniref:Uncharacterized protein n=1 Tax=Petrolisthes manimaculis TaxID=1843537 RepID=A0AAE1QGA4_9EUCA|nr:hypothetical protein Pmani_003206 [Petrolisthes manimaculis]
MFPSTSLPPPPPTSPLNLLASSPSSYLTPQPPCLLLPFLPHPSTSLPPPPPPTSPLNLLHVFLPLWARGDGGRGGGNEGRRDVNDFFTAHRRLRQT